MIKGKVKWYNETKGFGFIETESSGDVFVHRSGIVNPNTRLETGQEVEFEIKASDKGQVAFNVKSI